MASRTCLFSSQSTCRGFSGYAFFTRFTLQLLVCYCVLHLYLVHTAAQQQTVCPVQTTTGFFSSLTNATCDVILIVGKGFIFSREEMLQSVGTQLDDYVAVNRSLTIRGETSTTVLDVGYLKRRILLEAGVTLRVESVVAPHGRPASATNIAGLDIVYLNATSTLEMQDVTLVYAMCVSHYLTYSYAVRVARPIDIAGAQACAYTNATTCIPGLSNFTAQDSGLGAGALQVANDCFDGAFFLYDYALGGSPFDSAGVRIASGNVHYINTTVVCEHFPSEACVSSMSLAACIIPAIDAYGLRVWESYDAPGAAGAPPPTGRPPPTDSSSTLDSPSDGDSARRSSAILSVLLPCMLGGALFLSGLLGGALW